MPFVQIFVAMKLFPFFPENMLYTPEISSRLKSMESTRSYMALIEDHQSLNFN